MNNQIKVSIITVCYNSMKTIEETIQSVINQTYPNIEYIIIDGGSTDGTVDIIKKHENKIAYWVSEPDKGIYDAMNKGIDIANGDYIQFLGSDDCLISNDIIAKVVQILLTDNSIDILSGSVWMIDEELCLQKLYGKPFTKVDIYNGYIPPHQGMFTNRNLLQSIKFNINYTVVSDYEFFLKCYFNPSINFKYINLPIAFYSISGISSLLNVKHLEEKVHVTNKYNLNQSILLELQKKNNLNKKLIRFLRRHIKLFLKIIGCLKIIRRKRISSGWIEHSCEWTRCRWCKHD